MASSSRLLVAESNGFCSPQSRRERFAELTQECLYLEQHLEDTRLALATKRQKRAHFAPAYSLPDEIWCYIYTLIYAHRFPHCYRYIYDSKDSLIPLACVSRYFRQVALSLPSLWTCIHITPAPKYRKQHYPERIALLKTQLARSRNLPLTILFCCHQSSIFDWGASDGQEALILRTWYDFRQTNNFTHFQECWRILLEHSSRWRRLTIFVEHAQMFIDAWDLMKSQDKQPPQLPLLECLDIYADTRRDPFMPWSIDIHELQTLTPRLSSLRVHGLALGALEDEVRDARLPELPLTEIALVNCSVDLHDFGTLPLSHTLTTLVLRNIFSIRLPTTDPAVQFPCLKTLFLEGLAKSNQACGYLLSLVLTRAPRLEVIELDGVSDIDRLFSPALSFHSFPSVHTIVFRGAYNTVESGLFPPECPFLDPFPGLRRLYILMDTCYPYINTLLQRSRAIFPQSPCPWPQLERLTIASDEERDEEEEDDWVPSLLEFVKFRQQAGHPIRTVGLVPDFWSRDGHKPGLAASLETLGVAVYEWCTTPLLGTEESRWSSAREEYVHPEWIFDVERRYYEGVWY